MIRVRLTYVENGEKERFLKTLEQDYYVNDTTKNYFTKRNYNKYKNCFIELVKKDK